MNKPIMQGVSFLSLLLGSWVGPIQAPVLSPYGPYGPRPHRQHTGPAGGPARRPTGGPN
mgnify:CR=1 FL=1